MQNFEFYAPTRMIFGKDTHKQVGKLVKEYGFKKVFVHYGGASAKKSGLLDTVLDALKAEKYRLCDLRRRSGKSDSGYGKRRH